MEYSIKQIAKMSGVSTRTLRYYDEIKLLRPARVTSSGYRIYGKGEVDTLQQILFYRELEFSLEDIKELIYAPEFSKEKAFAGHLTLLNQKRERLDALIVNIERSIAAMKGEIVVSDKEKFEGFKKKLVEENEVKYGKEIREKYGAETVNESNMKMLGLTWEQYQEIERLSAEFEETLAAAFAGNNPAGEMAQKACDLHRQWLCMVYSRYSKEYHMGLGEMYVSDERFRVNYDKFGKGCTEFLRDAIRVYCGN